MSFLDGFLLIVGILGLCLVLFGIAYNIGYYHGAKAVLSCETDAECEEIAYRLGL